MITIRRILVPTDFGEPAAAALEYARDLARQYGAALHLLHVQDSIGARYAFDMSPAFIPEVQREMEEAATTRLAGLLTGGDRDQLHATTEVITSGAPSLTIVEYARTHDIDLIVMGTHGRGAISHFFMGSVAERVVRMARCPVLTVHHPEHEFIGPDALAVAVRV